MNLILFDDASWENLLINGSLLPDEALVKCIHRLPEHSALKKEGVLLAVRTGQSDTEQFDMEGWIIPGKYSKSNPDGEDHSIRSSLKSSVSFISFCQSYRVIPRRL